MAQPLIISGPALVTWNGTTFFSKDDIKVSFEHSYSDMVTDIHGIVDQAVMSTKLEVQFTPAGMNAEVNGVLAFVNGKKRGESLVPGGWHATTYAATGNASTNVVTFTGLTCVDGTAVTIVSKTGGTGVSLALTYYLRDSSGSTAKLALTPGGTAVALGTTISAAVFGLVRELPLVITPLHDSGGHARIWTFYRAGITAVPSLEVGAGKSPFGGDLTFTCLSSIIYSAPLTTSAWTAQPALTDFNEANIARIPAKAVWAASPSSLSSGDYEFYSQQGWQIALNLSTQSHMRDHMIGGVADVCMLDTNPVISGALSEVLDHTGAMVGEQNIHTIGALSSALPGQAQAVKLLTLRMLHPDTTDGSGSYNGTYDLYTFAKTQMETFSLIRGAASHRFAGVRFRARPTFASGAKVLPGGTSYPIGSP
jgi:hypothetical protein